MNNNLGKIIFSRPDQDMNPNLSVMAYLVYCESDTLDYAATKAVYSESSALDLANSEAVRLQIKCTEDVNKKREQYLEWADYFMATAFLAAKRSKDPCSQVGACIVSPDNKIVGVGYNGMPIGCSDDVFPWSKTTINKIDTKYLYGEGTQSADFKALTTMTSAVTYLNDEIHNVCRVVTVCHAEMNAILNKNSADVKGCTMYVGLFPCNECAKIIIQSGIVEVVYMSDKHSHKVKTQAAKRMFDFVGIKYSQYQPRMSQIVIDFTELDKNNIAPVLETPGDITHDATPSGYQ
uniref:dCMP deaminase n=1 Tax=Timema douglasi TaxID=61478 RepID=A0A7R8VKG9_TIMDO|nr:unnamed protein product [Timema douglasi]